VLKALFFLNNLIDFIDLTVMNKLTKELNNGFNGYIVDTSKPNRVLQCRDCNSVEIHNPKFFSLHGRSCEKGCGFGYTSEDLVPLSIKCKNCGNQKGFNFPDDSGVEEAEITNHEMYAKAKASMLEDNQSEDHIHILSDIESDIAESTQLAENNPRVKGVVEKQIFTIEPKDGFDSSGFVEKDLFHKGNIHETCYVSLVNAGNTPHMQRKIPIGKLISIRNSQAKGILNAWAPKTYGNASINRECKAKMGFSVECNNMGDRKLSDQKVKSLLTSIYFTQEIIKKITEIEQPSKDDIVELYKAEENVLRMIAVLKTGNTSSGHQSPMYDIKINTYDPVSLEKLGMELDIPWNEKPIDIYQLYQMVQAKKVKSK
jgi:hypothetical protein